MGKLIKSNKCLEEGVSREDLEQMSSEMTGTLDGIQDALEEMQGTLGQKFNKTGGLVTGMTVFGSGVTVNSDGTAGGLEMNGTMPYIDFHVANSTDDFTNRVLACFNRPGCIQTGYQLHLVGEGGVFASQDYGKVEGDGVYFGVYRNMDHTILGTCEQGCNVRDVLNGNVFRPIGASAFNTESSRRYKKNIEKMTEEEANKLDGIEVFTFDYKVEENGTGLAGVMAEDVYEVLPNVVSLAEVDGELVPDSVDYSKFVAYLIKRDQMKSERLAELEARLAVLESKEEAG